MAFALADVESEYAKNEELKREDVRLLREWAEKQPHLPKISELALVVFLKKCNFNNEIAKRRIDAYYTTRTLYKEIFGNQRPDDQSIQNAMDHVFYTFLPGRTHEGCVITLTTILDDSVENFSYLSHVRYVDMINTMFWNQHGTSNGIVSILDFGKCTAQHLLKIRIDVLKKTTRHMQAGYPLKLRSVHVINFFPGLDTLFSIWKSILSPKNRNKIQIHKAIEELHEYVPKHLLPEEYGGEAGSLEKMHAQQKELLKSSVGFFRSIENQFTDESKRIEKSEYEERESWGVEGTFKKLEID